MEYVFFIILIIWILLLFILIFILFNVWIQYYFNMSGQCFEIWEGNDRGCYVYSVIIMVFYYFVLMLVMMFCYMIIRYYIWLKYN